MFKTPRENKKELLSSLSLLFGAFFILLILGSIVFHLFEHWSYMDSLYFATISLTGRGFSSTVPHHWFSIIFSVFYLVIGVAILITSLSKLIAFYTVHYEGPVTKTIKSLKNKFSKKKKPQKWIVIKK